MVYDIECKASALADRFAFRGAKTRGKESGQPNDCYATIASQSYNEERYQEKLNSLTPLEYRYQAIAYIFCFSLST
ncbi:IS3 family transposase [Gracilibacillus sp. HCP3S3_G5_1]|uniref:IS3 family transposase n=1 Tax=unclassified Gracilibacillus TaxID=2625209 RepID=UPI003F8B7328